MLLSLRWAAAPRAPRLVLRRAGLAGRRKTRRRMRDWCRLRVPLRRRSAAPLLRYASPGAACRTVQRAGPVRVACLGPGGGCAFPLSGRPCRWSAGPGPGPGRGRGRGRLAWSAFFRFWPCGVSHLLVSWWGRPSCFPRGCAVSLVVRSPRGVPLCRSSAAGVSVRLVCSACGWAGWRRWPRGCFGLWVACGGRRCSRCVFVSAGSLPPAVQVVLFPVAVPRLFAAGPPGSGRLPVVRWCSPALLPAGRGPVASGRLSAGWRAVLAGLPFVWLAAVLVAWALRG